MNMTTDTSARGPLEGLKVLDLTIAMAGPMCSQRMGEMGAEIIKIEAPGGGDFSRHAPCRPQACLRCAVQSQT